MRKCAISRQILMVTWVNGDPPWIAGDSGPPASRRLAPGQRKVRQLPSAERADRPLRRRRHELPARHRGDGLDVAVKRPVARHRLRALTAASPPPRGWGGAALADRSPRRPSGSRSRGRCARWRRPAASLRALTLPMLTWSSLPALDGIESTLAGWQSTLFSLTSDALATCAIMKPECSPLPAARKGVSPVESAGLTSCSTRRSLMFASSATAIAARSSASASGCPWKLPPLMMSRARPSPRERRSGCRSRC